MRISVKLFGIGLALAVASGQASAQCLDQGARGIWQAPAVQIVPTPYCPQVPQPVPQAPVPGTQPGAPTPQPPTAETPAPSDLSFDARSAAGRGEAFALASPPMMGDFAGFCARRTIFVPTIQTFTTTITLPVIPNNPTAFPDPPTTSTTLTTIKKVASTQAVTVCDPLLTRAGSGFKIADDESPCPQDRVFFAYNYFDNFSGMGGITLGSTFLVKSTANSQTTVTIPTVGVAASNVNLNRELFGVEKTFLGGDASVELRVPIFQTTGDGSLNGDDFGDLTVILKYALFHNDTTGSCLSAGLAVTAPTGPTIDTVDGTIHDVLFQPFVGGAWHAGDLFVQGFSSLVVPTDARDVTLLFNDLGLGYTAYHGTRDGYISFVAPDMEVHVTTPLNHRGSGSPIAVADIVDLTPGVYLGIGERAVLSIGVAFPVTGAQAFDFEVLAQLNYRF